MVIFNISRCITLLKTWWYFNQPCQVYWRVRTSESQDLFFLRKIHREIFSNWCFSQPKTQNQQMNLHLRVQLWLKKWSYHGSFQVRSTRLLCLYIDIYLSNHEPNQLTTDHPGFQWRLTTSIPSIPGWESIPGELCRIHRWYKSWWFTYPQQFLYICLIFMVHVGK